MQSIKGKHIFILFAIISGATGCVNLFNNFLNQSYNVHSNNLSQINGNLEKKFDREKNNHLKPFTTSSLDEGSLLDYQRYIRWKEALELMEHFHIDINAETTAFILDTGLHPNLKDLTRDRIGYNARLAGQTFEGKPIPPIDLDGHGTAVAGVIGAIAGNDFLINGIGVNNWIYPIQVASLHEDNITTPDNVVLKIMLDALQHSYNVIHDEKLGVSPINISMGGYIYEHELDQFYKKFSSDEYQMVFITSAGNNNSTEPTYPSGYGFLESEHDIPNIISVGACSLNGEKADFEFDDEGKKIGTNYNLDRNISNQWVHIAAPGINIQTLSIELTPAIKKRLESALDLKFTQEEGELIKKFYPKQPTSTTYKTGTSLSAPIVSGIITLASKIIQHYKINNIGHNTLAQLLFKSSQYSPQTKNSNALEWCTYGIVDALGMMVCTLIKLDPTLKDEIAEFLSKKGYEIDSELLE